MGRVSIKKNSLSDLILITLEKSIEAAIHIEDFTYNTHLYVYSGYPRQIAMPPLYKAIKRLREKGYIETEGKELSKMLIKLTDEGKQQLLLSAEEPKEWDGKWRIVSFDIPESKRLVRDMFRRNLKKWGFKQVQKSVWISKKDILDKLFSYIKDLKIEEWVIAMESDKVGPKAIT